jgi:menaquinone-dependent protoporphyrinogen oxidase
MVAPILVTYATRYGSTREVAELIASVLRERGIESEVVPMPDVQSLEHYQSVVMGAPLYIGRWHKDAQRFLALHREALMKREVAIFTLGPTQDEVEDWEDVRTQLEKQMASVPWLNPVSSQLFGGKYDPETLRFPDTLLALLPASPLHDMPASDVRDWSAIRAWSEELAQHFAKELA